MLLRSLTIWKAKVSKEKAEAFRKEVLMYNCIASD
jgi:hypothetical protein